MLLLSSAVFLNNIYLFKKFIQEHYQSTIKYYGFYPHNQQLMLAGKEVNLKIPYLTY